MSDAATELARLVEEVSGNVVPPSHHLFLARAAEERVRATGQRSLAAYVELLRSGALPGEWGRLLPLVTINESYLFRTPQHFAALSSTLLPRLIAARAGTRRLRLWSAGCARGEEPATLAIVLAEMPELAGWDWRVVATDVDEEALAAARRGCYGGRAIASVPPHLRGRFLVGAGETLSLAPALLSRIDYRVFNLVSEPFVSPGDPFDVVFLRNVLIYFRPESQRRVATAVAGTLAADGYLFLGPAETLWQVTEELEPVDLGDSFCYRRTSPHPPTPGTGDRGPGTAKTGSAGRSAAVNRMPARERVAVQTTRGTATPITVPGPRSPVPIAVGTRERLQEAVRYLLADRLVEAVDLVDQALAADPADAQSHAIEGFIHDLSGRSEMAIPSLRAALYLDPSLFQVHLMLADALRRLGWSDRAEVSYRAVLRLLDTGSGRVLTDLAALPLADRASAAQRASAALVGR